MFNITKRLKDEFNLDIIDYLYDDEDQKDILIINKENINKNEIENWLNNNVNFPYNWSTSTYTISYKGFLKYINKKYQLGICIRDTM